MIEDHAIAYIIALIAIPFLVGIVVAIIDRPSKYYYVHDGWRWKKKRYKK